jgi:hypothetical protein
MKLIQRSTFFTIVFAFIAVCVLGIYSVKLKRNADNVIGVAYELSLKAQPPTSQELQQRFGSALKQPIPARLMVAG